MIEKKNLQKDAVLKMVTQHRVLTYLLQDRIISSYGKLVEKEYQNGDLITGQTNWCDFFNENEWGEIVLVHQENLSVQCLRKHLFTINIKEVEERYQIKVDPDSIAPLLQDVYASPTILLNTQSAIRVELEKKLKKIYPYQEKGYSRQGTLIVAICDPTFGGFSEDIEIRYNALDLECLKKITETMARKSSFNRALLVDGLTAFEENSENCVYELLPPFSP